MKTLLLTLGMALTSLAVSAQAAITSITPNSGQQNTQLTVQISGTSGSFGSATSTYVYFSQGSYNYFDGYNVTVNSSTSLTTQVNIPSNASLGAYDVEVGDYNGNIILAQAAFTVLQGQVPQLLSVDTNYAAVGTTLDVTISGLGTHFDQGSNTSLYFSQGTSSYISVNSFSVLDPATILANISVPGNQPLGFYDLTTYNDWDGYLTLPNAFVVTDTIAGIVVVNPLDTTGNDSTTLRVIGSGTSFGSPGTNTIVWLGQTSRSSVPNAMATNVHIINSNTLEATLQFASGAPAGWYDLYVLNSHDGLLTRQHAYNKKGVTGISDAGADRVAIYPNPVQSQLTVRVTAAMLYSDYTLTDLTGRIVQRGTIADRITTLSTSSLTEGVYVLQIGTETYKIVKE